MRLLKLPVQRENDPLALNSDIPAYLDDPLHPVVTGVQLLTDLNTLLVKWGLHFRTVFQFKINDEDPVFAKNRIQGSVPQTKGNF